MAQQKYLDQAGLQKTLGMLKTHLEATYRTIATSYTKDEVDNLIKAINKFDVKVADVLPTASADTMYTIYLVPKGEGKTGYTEHITLRSGEEGAYTYNWEEIGDTDIDLSNYVQKTFTIAGVDMQDNITAEELRTALNVEDGAQANVIETVKVNGTALTPDADKAVDITVPTKSEFGYDADNDEWSGAEGYVDGADLKTAMESFEDAISASVAESSVTEIKTGTTNGTIVYAMAKDPTNYQEVQVAGLGSAAYTDADDYDKAGDASLALDEAKIYADGLVKDAEGKSRFDAAGSAETVRDTIQGGGTSTIFELEDRLDVLEGEEHTHANKDLLDSYTQSDASIQIAVGLAHDHANIDELDKIADGDKEHWDNTSDLVDNIGKGLVGSGEHAISEEVISKWMEQDQETGEWRFTGNKSILGTIDTLETSSQSAHIHANKELLDSYTQSDASIQVAVEKAHEHANGVELDKIEVGDKDKWDGAADDASLALDLIAGLDTTSALTNDEVEDAFNAVFA